MSAILKFLTLLLLGMLALSLPATTVGVGYWQYVRQADLLYEFERLAWDSQIQERLITIEDDEGCDFIQPSSMNSCTQPSVSEPCT